MQTYPRFLPISLLVVLAAPLACADQEPDKNNNRFYAEGFIGSTSADFSSELAFDYGIAGLRGGFNITPNFAIEGEYATGTDSNNVSLTSMSPEELGGNTFLIDGTQDLSSVFSVFGKAKLPIADRFAIHGRAGYSSYEFEGSSRTVTLETGETTVRSFENSDSGFAFGAGVSFDFTEKIYARAEATNVILEADDVESVTIGIGVKF